MRDSCVHWYPVCSVGVRLRKYEVRGVAFRHFGNQTDRCTKPNFAQYKELLMFPRTEIFETKIYRRERDKDVLCLLTYEVTPFRDGLMRWFLVGIKELE